MFNKYCKNSIKLLILILLSFLTLSVTAQQKHSKSFERLDKDAFSVISLNKDIVLSVNGTDNFYEKQFQINGSGFHPFERVRIQIDFNSKVNRNQFILESSDIFADGEGKFNTDLRSYPLISAGESLVVNASGFETRKHIQVSIEQEADNFAPATYGELWINKHATPPSTFAFGFTTGNLSPSNFSLTDNSSSSDPRRIFYVTSSQIQTYTIDETNLGPYDLRTITCSYTNYGGGNPPTLSRVGDKLFVQMRYPEFVNCTFNNDFVTAAAVSVGGRVLNSSGFGLGRAIVSMTDGYGNVRTGITNHFGYYKFNNVGAGETYFFDIRHKSHVYTPQLITINEELRNLDFFPNP